jgi:hypothetical protein
MLYMWWRIDQLERQRVWRLFGWFSGLIFCGCCFGIVAWISRMITLVNNFNLTQFDDSDDLVQIFTLSSTVYSWRAAFTVTYAIDFMCLSIAKLMVLDRMSDFAVPKEGVMRKWWITAQRAVLVIAVIGNAVGLSGSIAAAAQFAKAAQAYRAASSSYASNSTDDGDRYESSAREYAQRALSTSSAQSISEAIVLLLLVAAFVITGSMCVYRFRSTLITVDAASAAASAGRALQLKVVATTCIVFAAFLLRSVFSTMYAVAYRLQDNDNSSCEYRFGKVCESECHNIYTHIVFWMAFTPEFQLTVVLISSPLTLLVALWGMTTQRMLQLMTSTQPHSKLQGSSVLLNSLGGTSARARATQ